MNRTSLLDELQGLLGESQVLTEGDLSAWEQDWRKRWHGKALAVVRPGSTDEVAQVVRACARHGASVVRKAATPGWWAAACPMPAAARCC